MMMNPPPAAPFEMIEAEFVLELLVIPLDPPAQVRQPNEGGQRGRLGQGREVVLRRRRLAQRPLTKDPFDGAGLGAALVMRRPDAEGDESRAHAAPGAFTPRHRGPRRGRQAPDEPRQADGVLARGALQAPRWATAEAAAPRRPRSHARWPHPRGLADADNIRNPARSERVPE